MLRVRTGDISLSINSYSLFQNWIICTDYFLCTRWWYIWYPRENKCLVSGKAMYEDHLGYNAVCAAINAWTKC